MTDIALRFGAGAAQGLDALLADWLLLPAGLGADDGLQTAILLSLYTDRQAREDDSLPDATPTTLPDRRGWWADGIGPADDPSDRIGSRLWLLARAKRTTAALRAAETYAREALAWLLADGIAQAVTVTAAWGGTAQDQLHLTVTISRAGQPPARFETLWAGT